MKRLPSGSASRINVVNDEIGPKVVFSGNWNAAAAKAVRRLGLKRLHISFAGDRLDHLAGLDNLEELTVIDLRLPSDGGVSALPQLRALSLETYSDDRIDFRTFDRLERLAINWRPRAETAFACNSLKSLRVSRYQFSDLEPLKGLSRLEGLQIVNSPKLVSLGGVQALPSLRVISMGYNRSLKDIEALASVEHSLVEFELYACRKVGDISSLKNHRDLRRMMLIDCGRIASLAPLGQLPVLEEFWFYGTTVIEDGDMTPLLEMPALQRVSFAPRRHYTHTAEEIERIRGLKESEPLPHWRW